MSKITINDRRNRKMTKSGAVTIPSDLRRKLGFLEGGAVQLTISDKGEIVLKPTTPVCAICAKNPAVKKERKVPICSDCAGKIGSLYEKE